MRQTIIYARVSTKDQEREGFSIPAQLKFLREYAQRNQLQIVREFVDVETAKVAGRKQFGEMVRFLEASPDCRRVLVEKTDRLYRNLRDCVTLEDLNVEIHLVKEGQVIGRESKSQDKLMHGIQLVLARNYVENLREEVRKGMREKAEQGIYPARPPVGYRNNKAERTIEIDPARAPIAQRLFDLYGSGRHSLLTLRNAIRTEFGVAYPNGYLQRLLKNPFYVGLFVWGGKVYPGTHQPLISRAVFDRVQDVLHGRNRGKLAKKGFAFSGLLQCAYDNCAVTAEIKKGKYTYYHCTGYRGKCELPYFREEEIAKRLGEPLRNIRIPDPVLAQLEDSLLADRDREQEVRQEKINRLQQRLTTVRRRLDRAYLDKLDGHITEGFWNAKSAEWHEEEGRLLAEISELDQAKPGRLLDGVRILELAHKAYFLYLRQSPAEKAKLLKMVLSNCSIDAVSVYPTYRKPFDLIFQAAQTERWWTWGDSNPRPPACKYLPHAKPTTYEAILPRASIGHN
jgi:site-specific DNA recombinase